MILLTFFWFILSFPIDQRLAILILFGFLRLLSIFCRAILNLAFSFLGSSWSSVLFRHILSKERRSKAQELVKLLLEYQDAFNQNKLEYHESRVSERVANSCNDEQMVCKGCVDFYRSKERLSCHIGKDFQVLANTLVLLYLTVDAKDLIVTDTRKLSD